MTLQSSSQHFSYYTFFRITHTIFICSIYCFLFYCVLCIILQCSNILQLQYVFFVVGYTHHHLSHNFTSSSSVGLVFDYWKLHGARRTLRNVALILMRVLLLLWPHRSIDLECYQLFTCLLLCKCVSVHVWRLFGLVGSIIRICYHHHSLPLSCFCLFWCYYSIIVISFQLLLLHIVCDAWFRVSVVYAWECFWAFFVIFFKFSLLFPLQ